MESGRRTASRYGCGGTTRWRRSARNTSNWAAGSCRRSPVPSTTARTERSGCTCPPTGRWPTAAKRPRRLPRSAPPEVVAVTAGAEAGGLDDVDGLVEQRAHPQRQVRVAAEGHGAAALVPPPGQQRRPTTSGCGCSSPAPGRTPRAPGTPRGTRPRTPPRRTAPRRAGQYRRGKSACASTSNASDPLTSRSSSAR